MKNILVFSLLVSIFILWGCNSDNPVQPNSNVVENPDSVVSEYNNATDFMARYPLVQMGIVPGLRIDSVETVVGLPPIITYGRLIVYYNNNFIDSIPYGPAYHWSGYARPTTSAGQIQTGKYLIRVQNQNDEEYFSGKSIWYYADVTGIKLLPKVASKDGNGIYEINNGNFTFLNVGSVKKSNNKIIFYGYDYCIQEIYCTFNLNGIFKNYSRSRTMCSDPWKWN